MTSCIVTVLGDDTAVCQDFTTPTCSYILQGSLLASNYTTIVTSINGDGSTGPKDRDSIYSEFDFLKCLDLYIVAIYKLSLITCSLWQ